MPDKIETDSSWHDAQIVAFILLFLICIVPIVAGKLCQIAYRNWRQRRAESNSNRSSG